ncbi:hypothetical protein E4U42_005072 [Claviceps africana]|uniref:Uncharacterized protein n=1 Tax=Claviceps africana TaxID=83212 RepID=A0A8K0J6F6_9HYPO|nr:hypothetical protein E4U42_005072 [Claviceps africana]
MADVPSETSTASLRPEPIVEEEEVSVTNGTVAIRWDVKGGKDRPHKAYMNTNYRLEGSPNIQGITISSSIPVKVLCYGGNPDDSPDLVLDGPTDGKNTFTPIRLASYRVEAR